MSKLETNTIDTVSGTSTLQVGSTNTSTITLGVSGDTINVPSGVTINNNGTQTGFGGVMTPAFSAVKLNQTTGQSDNTYTKITYDTELYDSNGKFASDKFTPTVAGKYYISLSATAGTSSASSVTSLAIKIYKNGSELAGTGNVAKPEQEVELLNMATSAIVTLDDDDYVEAFIKIDFSTGTGRVTTSQFSGFKIIE